MPDGPIVMQIKLPKPGWLALATVVLLLVAGIVALAAPRIRILFLQTEALNL